MLYIFPAISPLEIVLKHITLLPAGLPIPLLCHEILIAIVIKQKKANCSIDEADLLKTNAAYM